MGEGKVTMEALWDKLDTMTTVNSQNHNEVKIKLDSIQSNFDSVNVVLDEHTKKLGRLDYSDRRKNLVIFGVPEDQTDIEKIVMTLFCTHLKVEGFTLMELDFCRRLGKQTNYDKPRAILVGLITQRRKVEILKKTALLKGTSIFVKQDISEEARSKHKKLREERDRLRKQGIGAVIRSGRIIREESHASRTEFNSTVGIARTSSKRALSESPGDIPDRQKSAPKKINRKVSEEELFETTMIETQQNQHAANYDNFSQTSNEFSSPLQSPLQNPRKNHTVNNLRQSSIVTYLNTEEDTNSKN